MKFSLLMIGMLTLSGCISPVGSDAEAICEIPRPTITEEEAAMLSDRSLEEMATYYERLRAACGK